MHTKRGYLERSHLLSPEAAFLMLELNFPRDDKLEYLELRKILYMIKV